MEEEITNGGLARGRNNGEGGDGGRMNNGDDK